MIGATTYPYADTPKTAADARGRRGCRHGPAAARRWRSASRGDAARSRSRLGEIATPSYGNVHGLPRATCRLCGECDIGCNDGAKNTLDHTYLSAAQHAGADIRTRHEVKGFRPLPTGRRLRGRATSCTTGADGEPAVDLPTQTIRCHRLVLAAGTFGTTYLLLRNRAALPGLSAALGTRFSGNGDLLGLILNAARDGVGRDLDANTGPVITSAIRVADEADGDGVDGPRLLRRGRRLPRVRRLARRDRQGRHRHAWPGRSGSATGAPSRT